jgi:hypothetical protein
MSLLKIGGWEGKTGPSGGWYQWEGGGYKEMVKEVNMMEMLCTHV